MSTEQTTTPDSAPEWPPMRFVGWSVDRVDGSSSFGTFDRRETADEWCERLRGYGNDVHVVRYELPDEMAILSGLLRGMARRVGKHRVAFDDLRRHMSRAGMKLGRELDEAREELARVRPVVDAARAYIAAPAGQAALSAFRRLDDAVAALDGDAAATPQPAAAPDRTIERVVAAYSRVPRTVRAMVSDELADALDELRALATPTTDTTPTLEGTDA